MEREKIVFVSGKARHGKDTIATEMQGLLTARGERVLVVHLADLLKFICKTYFGWNGEKDEAGRTLLQYVGTDIIRKKRPRMWSEFIAQMLYYFRGNWDVIIVPDGRFPDELLTFREYGFDTTHLRVIRSNFTSPLSEEQLRHPSETALDATVPDYIIHNDATIEELKRKVEEFIDTYLLVE